MPDPAEMSAEEIYEYLEEHDVALMFITDDDGIHHIEFDDGDLTFYSRGKYGYDPETSFGVLRDLASNDGPLKFVPAAEVPTEREKLGSGEYESPQEWVNDE